MFLVIITPVLSAPNTTITCTGVGSSTSCIINEQNNTETLLLMFLFLLWIVVLIVSVKIPLLFLLDVAIAVMLCIDMGTYWLGMSIFVSLIPVVITAIMGVLVVLMKLT